MQKRITFGGKPRNFEFGALLFYLYEQETGQPSGVLIERFIRFARAAQKMTDESGLVGFDVTPLVDTAYYALKAAAEMNDEPFTESKLKVASKMGMKVADLTPIIVGFIDGLPRESNDEPPSEAKKKKARPITS